MRDFQGGNAAKKVTSSLSILSHERKNDRSKLSGKRGRRNHAKDLRSLSGSVNSGKRPRSTFLLYLFFLPQLVVRLLIQGEDKWPISQCS